MIERKPGIFIPTLYFAEGLPYTIVMMMSGVFFKSLGASNVFIGLTSFLSLPWILKFAWAPMVDYYASRRTWIVVAQVVLSLLIVAAASVAPTGFAVGAGVTVLFAIAIASATQDVAIDGYYLDVLSEKEKAFFVGVRNAAYKIAWLFGSGALVALAGALGKTWGLGLGWAAAFGICAAVTAILAVFHNWYLPDPEKVVLATDDACKQYSSSNGQSQEELGGSKSSSLTPQGSEPVDTTSETSTVAAPGGADFYSALKTYFQQPGIVAIVTYILLFRLGDAFMLKQAPNFLLDPREAGGLGLSVSDVGIINGTVGVLFLLCGGICGSWLVSRGGLRRWLWPTAIIQNSAILLYFALAIFKPSLEWVYVVNSAEQFSYGLGVAAYTVFLLKTVRSRYKAANYATATALMALGMMLPGAASGFLWQCMGYANFFLFSFLCSIPGIITIFYLPIWRADSVPEVAGQSGGFTSGISKTGQVGSENQ